MPRDPPPPRKTARTRRVDPGPVPLVLKKQDERCLDTIFLGPSSEYSLCTLALRAIQYHDEWERGHDALQSDPARYDDMSKSYTELARTGMEGRDLIFHGDESIKEHQGVTKWTKNLKLLFDTLDK